MENYLKLIKRKINRSTFIILMIIAIALGVFIPVAIINNVKPLIISAAIVFAMIAFLFATLSKLELNKNLFNYQNLLRNSYKDIQSVKANKEVMALLNSNMGEKEVVALSGMSSYRLINTIVNECTGAITGRSKNIMAVLFANYKKELNIEENKISVSQIGNTFILITFLAIIAISVFSFIGSDWGLW